MTRRPCDTWKTSTRTGRSRRRVKEIRTCARAAWPTRSGSRHHRCTRPLPGHGCGGRRAAAHFGGRPSAARCRSRCCRPCTRPRCVLERTTDPTSRSCSAVPRCCCACSARRSRRAPSGCTTGGRVRVDQLRVARVAGLRAGGNAALHARLGPRAGGALRARDGGPSCLRGARVGAGALGDLVLADGDGEALARRMRPARRGGNQRAHGGQHKSPNPAQRDFSVSSSARPARLPADSVPERRFARRHPSGSRWLLRGGG